MDKKELNSYLRDLHSDLTRLQTAAENSLDQINHLIADIHRTRMDLIDMPRNPKTVMDELFGQLEKGFK